MNIRKKTFTFLLLTIAIYAPLLAQKKLALANECFNAKAYYLASRYYQQVFDKTNNCHPDQIKLAQSLAATQQLNEAENAFKTYLNCHPDNPKANIAYGKFLIDIEAYEKATSYFKKSMDAEPELARHYMLVCQTALPKVVESASPVFVKQSTEVTAPQTTTIAVESPKLSPAESKPKLSVATNDINLYKTMAPEKQFNHTPAKLVSQEANQEDEEERVKEMIPIIIEKKISPYGVRLGTFQPSKVPNLSAVESYGRIERKQWNGKTIVYLVDFYSRGAAEAALKMARSKNFRSATLVEKLASGRLKSVR